MGYRDNLSIILDYIDFNHWAAAAIQTMQLFNQIQAVSFLFSLKTLLEIEGSKISNVHYVINYFNSCCIAI